VEGYMRMHIIKLDTASWSVVGTSVDMRGINKKVPGPSTIYTDFGLTVFCARLSIHVLDSHFHIGLDRISPHSSAPMTTHHITRSAEKLLGSFGGINQKLF